MVHIMVENKEFTGILDREDSGFFTVWRISLVQELFHLIW